MQRKILSTLLFALFSIAILGCGPISNVNIDRTGATVDVVLEEKQVDKILKHSDLTMEDEDGSILDEITDVNFREGYIEVAGTYTNDSGETQTGGFDIEIGATDGVLNVKLANVDITNVDPAEIEKANQELADEFASAANRDDVEFREVLVTESKMVMQIIVKF